MKTVGNWFDKLWNWAVYSSANPENVSGTVKWGFALLGTLLTGTANLTGIHIVNDQITGISDSVIAVVQDVALLVTALGTAISLLRKVWLSLPFVPKPPAAQQ